MCNLKDYYTESQMLELGLTPAQVDKFKEESSVVKIGAATLFRRDVVNEELVLSGKEISETESYDVDLEEWGCAVDTAQRMGCTRANVYEVCERMKIPGLPLLFKKQGVKRKC